MNNRSQPPLTTLVLERLAALGDKDGPMSYRDAAARSGGLVSHATIGKIAKGTPPKAMRGMTIKGLSLALSVPEQQIRRTANLPSQEPFELVLPKRVSLLPTEQQQAVIKAAMAVADALLAEQQRRSN